MRASRRLIGGSELDVTGRSIPSTLSRWAVIESLTAFSTTVTKRERGKKREKRDLRNLDPVGGVAVDDRTRGVLGLEKLKAEVKNQSLRSLNQVSIFFFSSSGVWLVVWHFCKWGLRKRLCGGLTEKELSMCSGSKRKLCPTMEGEVQKQEAFCCNFSLLLELSAANDLIGFRTAVEEEGRDVDEASFWYGRRNGSKKMGFEERTPLMIAAMFGSKEVLNYILATNRVDVNRACGSDGATALHCAVAGASASLPEVVKLLLDASADANCVDARGNRPGDLIAPILSLTFNSRKKAVEVMLKGSSSIGEAFQRVYGTPEKKEYPVDLSLPDIKNGIYGTDEFRMYTFKVKPCSRAYSHDWTECPFVHPGENARRRDPRKYHYSCVPCPEFRKGSCRQGDACEYAHGIFECWLHPAQYRTRLCKDETGCTRRVCFFAHKPEELRPLYASTGSAVPSPRSFSVGASSLDMSPISPLALGSSSVLMPPTSTPPMTPSGVSSPMGGTMWQNQPNIIPPNLQLSGSRLKSSLSARDMDLDVLGLESHRRRQQQLMDEMAGLSSPSSWNSELNRLGGMKPTNLEDIFGSLDPTILPQLQGLSMDAAAPQLHLSSSPVRGSASFGMDPSGSATAAVLNSRAAAFAKRSQTVVPSPLSDWGSPDGKLDWGIQGEELNKLRKSASFGFRSNGSSYAAQAASVPAAADEPDVSWVQSLVKEAPSARPGQFGYEEQHQYHLNSGGSEILPPWVEQLCVEQEQMVA
ncbi:unnamed protein product, partial [Vitis vinifera]